MTINDLHHTTGAMPRWARFYLDLGSLLAGKMDVQTQAVTGLAIPTRAYAAVLISAGVVGARSEIPTKPDGAHEYFEWLCELPVGTAVTVRRGDRIWKGLLCDRETSSGKDLIRIQQQSNLDCLFPLESSLNIQVTTQNIRRLPRTQKPRRVVSVDELAEQNQFVRHLPSGRGLAGAHYILAT